ncbi:MAG TPA: GntR family transcriptional regulator [Firmicutes bacterium]|nr:GntR family transcriptional regulator [Bacillota bacterium]
MDLSLRDRAYQLIKRSIVQNQIEPGDVISVSDLMSRFKLGRTPVREALLKLHDEGVVHIIPRKGIVVPGISSHRIRDLMELRMALETFAVEKICSMRDRPEIGRLHEKLGQILLVQREALDRHDEDLFTSKDEEMHIAVIEASGNIEFINTIDRIRQEVLRAGFTGFAVSVDQEEAFREHEAIVKAIRDGDTTKARDSVRIHLTRNKRLVLAC